MRTLIASLLLATTATSAAATATSAQAATDTRPCVTVREYLAVREGWTKTRTQRRFDTAGRLHIDYGDGDGHHTKRYRGCQDYSTIYVHYRRGHNGLMRVTGKEYW